MPNPTLPLIPNPNSNANDFAQTMPVQLVDDAGNGVAPLQAGGSVALTGAIPAGENHIGEVGTRSLLSSAVPNTASFATPYIAGDAVGGKLSFANMARASDKGGTLMKALLYSKIAQSIPFDLWLFHTDPTASTVTDNSPFVLALADFDKISAIIPFSVFFSGNPACVAQVLAAGNQYKLATGSTTMYGVLVARGGVTLTTATDLKIALGAIGD